MFDLKFSAKKQNATWRLCGVIMVCGVLGCGTQSPEEEPFTEVDMTDDAYGTARQEENLRTNIADIAPAPVRGCGALPLSCSMPAAPAVEHQIERIEACEFALRLRRNESLFEEFTAQMRARRGAPVALSALDFNRVANSDFSALNAERMKNHDLFGFSWQKGDASTPDWYPQGITGTEDAYADPSGRPRQLMVSWYDKATDGGPPRGARLSVVNLDETITYRHILLVEPVRKRDGSLEMKPLLESKSRSLHAGGIVWLGDRLYVADTYRGIRVFDLRHIYEVETARKALQFDDQAVRGLGYRYVLPQRAMYVNESQRGCKSRFSFLGLDRTGPEPVLSSGEYNKNNVQGRVLLWPVEPKTGWLRQEDDGTVRAAQAYVSGQSKMQGALSIHGDLVISSSWQKPNGVGRIYNTRPGQVSQITAWPKGAEDLYYERSTGRIWTPAEYPNERDTISIPYVPFVSP